MLTAADHSTFRGVWWKTPETGASQWLEEGWTFVAR